MTDGMSSPAPPRFFAIDRRTARHGQDWYDVCKLKPRDVTVLAFLVR